MDTTLGQREVPLKGRPRATLVVLWTPDGGFHHRHEDHVLPPGDTIIGRDGDVKVDDPSASRHHVRLVHTERTGLVEAHDLGSRNGTELHGNLIGEAPLSDGDVLRVGDSFFLLRYKDEDQDDAIVPGLLGPSPAMARVRSMVDVVATTPATVLLVGESGTGKEVVARAIHDRSGRAGAWIAVNCAAIPEALAESQLFGHRSGSFTGARGDHAGFFQQADGGTLFLDELGELPLTLQAKLLRVFEEKAVRPVGGDKMIPCDARVVAATNRDLAAEIESRRFRGDLFARLAQVTLDLWPLRDRLEDLAFFAGRRLEGRVLHPGLVQGLLDHPWPYNVRELMSVLTEIEVRSQPGTEVALDLVGTRLQAAPRTEPAPAERAPRPDTDELLGLLRDHDGNISRVARATGRSRAQVYRWVREAGIDLTNLRKDEDTAETEPATS